MKHEYTPVVVQEGGWFGAWCAEFPEANGQGRTRAEALASLEQAIQLVREDRRLDALEREAAAAG